MALPAAKPKVKSTAPCSYQRLRTVRAASGNEKVFVVLDSLYSRSIIFIREEKLRIVVLFANKQCGRPVEIMKNGSVIYRLSQLVSYRDTKEMV